MILLINLLSVSQMPQTRPMRIKLLILGVTIYQWEHAHGQFYADCNI